MRVTQSELLHKTASYVPSTSYIQVSGAAYLYSCPLVCRVSETESLPEEASKLPASSKQE